jgi:AcrR family transcriptional regulator
MTQKQESILETSLELFSTDGYAATSTSRIAHRAGVSEGLIFRHFKNKQGLLDALLKEADALMGKQLGPILFETSPKKVIRKVIKMPFKSKDQKEQALWKLQYMLKWETEYNHPKKMKPLIQKLTATFTELKYKDPKNEAVLLNHITDNISTEILKGNLEKVSPFREFLLKKYKV